MVPQALHIGTRQNPYKAHRLNATRPSIKLDLNSLDQPEAIAGPCYCPQRRRSRDRRHYSLQTLPQSLMVKQSASQSNSGKSLHSMKSIQNTVPRNLILPPTHRNPQHPITPPPNTLACARLEPIRCTENSASNIAAHAQSDERARKAAEHGQDSTTITEILPSGR